MCMFVSFYDAFLSLVSSQKNAKGEDLLLSVANHLNLLEKDYFGLQFLDAHDTVSWIDLGKRISKQFKGN